MSDTVPDPRPEASNPTNPTGPTGPDDLTGTTDETEPAAPGRAAEAPETGLADLHDRVAELEDQRLRALADLDNLRKRCAAQATRAATEAGSSVASQWLPVVDNLDRALSHADGEPDAVLAGVRAIRDQALEVLAKLGYARQDDLGEVFDPARHEAIALRPDPHAGAGTVIEVLQAGYGEGDHQLRPAQVVVAERPDEASARGQDLGAG